MSIPFDKVRRGYIGAALVALNTVLLFGILEVGARLLLPPAPVWGDRGGLRHLLLSQPGGRAFDRDARAYGYPLRPAPHVGFVAAPFTSPTLNVGQDGFRVVPGASDTAARSIMLLGGSTLFGVGTPDQATIPAYLQAADPSHRILNHSVPFWMSTQELIDFTLALRSSAAPEAVVFYDGVNEVARAVEALGPDTPAQPPAADCPVRSRFLFAVVEFARRRGRAVPHIACVDPPPGPWGADASRYARLSDGERQALAQGVAETYLRNVAVARRLALSSHVVPVFVWQPTLYTSRKLLSDYERGVLAGANPANADLMRRVDRQIHAALPSHPELHDFSGMLDTLSGTVFEDGWHLLPRGNAVIARALLDLLRAQGVGARARLVPGVRNESRHQ
jgi:hypothetical protein